MSRLPLRRTIPAIAVALVLVAETVLGVAVLALTQRQLRDQADHKLEEVTNELLSRPGQLASRVDEESGPNGQPRPRSEVLVAVYRESGALAKGITARLNDGRDVPAVRVDRDASAPYTARADGETWRVLVTASEGERLTVVATVPLRDASSTVAALRRLLIGLGIAVAIATAVLAFVATKRSLRPLADAERAAARIASGDRDARVPTHAPASEAGSLAVSLNAMLDQLTASVAARDASEAKLRQFVADASHELRTPLAAIKGYAELSRMGADTSGRALERIEANAQRMAAMVDDLLTLARFDESAAALGGDEEVDVAQLVRDAAADLMAQDPSRTVTVAAAPGAVVRGSARHLGQMFANLAGNVLTHTPAGTPVEFTASSHGTTVTVTVRDHGPGFGGDHARLAFERFYRADESRTRGTGGNGLGLAIVAAIAAAHAGSASAADAEGGGAIITVTLPAWDGSPTPA